MRERQLVELMDDLLNPSFDCDAAVARLGEPTQKTPDRWWLQPRDPELAGICLYFEDLMAGKGLLTTIEMGLTSPWNVTLEQLEQAIGAPHRWLPRDDSSRPRPLCFDRAVKELTGMMMVMVEPKATDDHPTVLTINSMLLRRLFPTEMPCVSPSD